MGLPIYQIQMYQKPTPIVNHTNITQKSPNLSLQLKNIKNLWKKSNVKNTVTSHYFQYNLKEVPFHASQMTHPKPLDTTQQSKQKNTSRMSLCTIKPVILTGKPLLAAL